MLVALHNFPEGIAVLLASQKSTAVGEFVASNMPGSGLGLTVIGQSQMIWLGSHSHAY
jgi:zinc transporter ZupT